MSTQVPTIKVKPWGDDQGDFVLINEADFNDDIHELYDEADARPASHGLNVAQLKEALEAKGIAIPDGALKADLAKLLDEAPAE